MQFLISISFSFVPPVLRRSKITKSKTLSFKCNDKKLNVKKILKEAQKKSNGEIKAELKKKGIDIKSNKNKLLKDLYMFTQCDNLNIVKE